MGTVGDLNIRISVSGLDDIDARLRQLPSQIANRAIRNAMKEAGDVIRQEIEDRAPVATAIPTPGSNALPPGTLKANIVTKVYVLPDNNSVVALVGPNWRAEFVARWLELGFVHSAHTRPVRPSDGVPRGGRRKRLRVLTIKGEFVPPKPFIRPAFDATEQAALDKFSESLEENLDAAVNGGAN